LAPARGCRLPQLQHSIQRQRNRRKDAGRTTPLREQRGDDATGLDHETRTAGRLLEGRPSQPRHGRVRIHRWTCSTDD
ncbi:hypothetical protein ABTM51_20840, partial [Acinetobacter baumannii]